MASAAALRLESLALSATELRNKTDWDETIIREWLNFVRNLILLAEELDVKNNILTITTFVNVPAYQILDTDEEIIFNTDATAITALLPEGVAGRNYRMTNVGTSGNAVTLTPDGTELLFGVNGPENIYDDETLIMTYNTDYGWW